MRKILPYIVLIVGCIFVSFFPASTAHALRASDTCSNIETVFARGSGDSSQLIRDSATTSFIDSLERSGADTHIYILGDESYNGHQYPHVAIAGFQDNGYINGVGAVVSSGERFTYGQSVDSGTTELTAYLNQRMNNCPNAKYIVGGYSQGAQVVASALPFLSESERAKITYVALFGNPKLYLPEAHSFEAYRDDAQATGDPLPDSCYGTNLSPWRNVVDDCFTFSGKLYSEKSPAFYPNDIQARIHEWCFDEDGICDSKKESWGRGHTEYSNHQGVPRAVNEALMASGMVPKVSFIDLTSSSKRYDILFEIPMRCTPLFRFSSPIPSLAVPYSIRKISDRAKQVFIIEEIIYDINQGGDRSEMLQRIALLWREGTEHIRYRISPQNCADEYVSQNTIPQFLRPQTNIQQSMAFVLNGESIVDPVLEYNNATILSEIPDDPVCQASTNCHAIDTMSSILTQPEPLYPAIKNITNTINSNVSYQLSQSSSLSLYDTYLWDINADGFTDITTTDPSLVYAYATPYSGPLRVTATSTASGLTSSTEFNVTILPSYSAPTKPLAPMNLSVTRLSNTVASFSWTRDSADTQTAGWVVRIDDFPVAKTTLSTTSITITDLDFSNGTPVNMSVAGLTGLELEGVQSSVALQPIATTTEVTKTNGNTGLVSPLKASAPQFAPSRPIAFYETSPIQIGVGAVTEPLVASVEPQRLSISDAPPNPWLTVITIATIIMATIITIIFRKYVGKKSH